MGYNKLCFFALAALMLALGTSQGCDNKVRVSNTAPSGLNIIVRGCFVATGGTVQLVGDAEDADGDSLTFSWKASKGTFTPASATGAAVDWKAPAEAGAVVITMTVTDEVVKVSKSQGITVCTPLPSSITSSRTLENTGYVYILLNNGRLRIPPNDTLTIEPGVTIVIDKESGGFEAYGHIAARGNPSNKIKMQGNTCTTGTGLWGGIYLYEEDSEGIFSNVDIAMSKDGIQVEDQAKLTIDNCEIYDNADMGISVLNAGSRAQIHSCKIWDNGTGIYVLNGEADIRGSSIRYSDGNGIELSFSRDTTPVTIDSCSIGNNGMSGIQLSEGAAPEIHHCSIFSNGENAGEADYGIRLAFYTAVDSIQAQNNYWGVNINTPAKISAVIHDAQDNPLLKAYVDFTPWLSVSPVMAAPDDGRGAKGGAWARLWR